MAPPSSRFTSSGSVPTPFFRELAVALEHVGQEIMTVPNLAPVLQSHFIKMQRTVASLALVFELVGHGHDVIGAKATARAIEWANYLKSHTVRLYSIGSQIAENGARLILERRAQLPECFTAPQVYRKGWVAGAAEASIDILIQAGYCHEQAVPPADEV
jgi:hypothetical protein